MSTTETVIASTANLDGKPPAPQARIRRNTNAVAESANGQTQQFVGWTEGWSAAAPPAVRAAFPHHRLTRPRKPNGLGMSVMASSILGDRWRLESTNTVKVSDPLWYRGRFLSDARYLLLNRYTTPSGHAFLLGVLHYNPDGTWAGAGAIRVTEPAREKAVRITQDALRTGGAPALLLGDPNLSGPFLGSSIRRANGTVCRIQYVGAGRVDRAVFVDGVSGKWGKPRGSRSEYPANPGHPLGWLRVRGTVTWP